MLLQKVNTAHIVTVALRQLFFSICFHCFPFFFCFNFTFAFAVVIVTAVAAVGNDNCVVVAFLRLAVFKYNFSSLLQSLFFFFFFCCFFLLPLSFFLLTAVVKLHEFCTKTFIYIQMNVQIMCCRYHQILSPVITVLAWNLILNRFSAKRVFSFLLNRSVKKIGVKEIFIHFLKV